MCEKSSKNVIFIGGLYPSSFLIDLGMSES